MEERRAQVGGIEVFWREAPTTDSGPPVVYVHGVPTNSDDWLPFLEKTGGLAIDLPGFGRSAKPSDFPYSIEGYTGYLDAWLAEAGVDKYRLVVHDWGGLGLVLAPRAPERVERVVVMNALVMLPGYSWHRVARGWRTPLVGEMMMGFTFKANMRRSLRRAVPGGNVPDDFLESIWSHFDHGTQRAILKLYRSARENVAALDAVTAPALVVWGADDPYLEPSWAERIAVRVPVPATVEIVPGGGHWPWFGQPEILQFVARHLELSAT